MIRTIVLFWALPLGFFWSWYFLSLNDVNFGTLFFSRALHDYVFAIYGDILGVDPASIPPMIARALVVDSSIVAAFVAFRRRRQIRAWLEARRAKDAPAGAALQAPVLRSEDSLSSAP